MMRFRINTDGFGEITRGPRLKIEIEKNPDDLAVGNHGLSIKKD